MVTTNQAKTQGTQPEGSKPASAHNGPGAGSKSASAHNQPSSTRHGHHKQAVHTAIEKNTVHVDVPFVGHVALPPPEQIIWYSTIAAMTAVGVLEWPLAVIVSFGHALATLRSNKVLSDVGDAMEAGA
ncbi:MAG: hypothetical protein ACYDH5_18935 [Acidimicrobiales bacterium]